LHGNHRGGFGVVLNGHAEGVLGRHVSEVLLVIGRVDDHAEKAIPHLINDNVVHQAAVGIGQQ